MERKPLRLTEPSSHAGIAATIAGVAPFLPPVLQPYAAIASAFFGALAYFFRETGNKKGD